MNRDDSHRTTGDDFWGNQSDWTSGAERPTTEHERFDAAAHWAGRTDAAAHRPVARLRRGLSGLLGSGSHATREHGIVRPQQALDSSAATPPMGVRSDMFDDLDDGDYTYDTDDTRTTYGAAPRYDDRPTTVGRATTGPIAVTAPFDDDDESWDAEFTPTPVDERHARRATAIDPLLVRIGAVAVVGALIVPFLLNAGSDGGDQLVGTAGATEEVASTITLLPPTTVIEPVDATTTRLDPNDLPPAVPVNEPAPASTSGEPTSTAAAEIRASASTSATLTAPAAGSSTSTTSTTQTAALDAAAGADAPATRVERSCAVDYTVVAGDYWIRLADAAGVDLAELLDANGASVDTPLYPGADICLPAGATTPAPPTTAAPTTTTPPTTAAPTTTAPPTTAAPTTTTATTNPPTTTRPTSSSDVKQIIRDVWPDELEDRALEIAYRESRYVPTAKNYCCYGIFQIYWNVHKSWLDDIGITSDQQLYDPATNARAAYALYLRAGGWGPWAL